MNITDSLIAIGFMLSACGLMSFLIWEATKHFKRAEKRRIQYLEEFLKSRRPPSAKHEDKQ